MSSLVKIWLYLVCANAVLGFVNVLALVFAPLVCIATVSLTLAYFYVLTCENGLLWEWISTPVEAKG